MLLTMFRLLFVVSIAWVLTPFSIAQCELQWQPGDPCSMPRGNVYATALWDPDGAGPATTVLVAGGNLTIGTRSIAVATWNGSQWVDIGSPLLATVTAIAVYNSELIVAGNGKFHRRTGLTWQQIGTYAVTFNNAAVERMVVFGTDLIAAGRFDSVSGFAANNIARWNGTAWSPLGTGVNGWLYALAAYPYQGQSALYVGGNFTSAGGVTTNNLAIWTGSTWAATAGCNAYVFTLAVRSTATALTTDLFVGGNFTAVGALPVNKVARYNANANVWTAMGALAATTDPCSTLLVRNVGLNYQLIATQNAQAWLWSGSAWNLMGPPLETGAPSNTSSRWITALTYFGGRFVVGLRDYFGLIGGVWSFDGTAWQSLDGVGIDRRVNAVLPVGYDVVIGGGFRSISGVAMNGVAIGNSNNWQPLAAGVTGGTGEVFALARLSNGNLVAGGSFTVAGGGAGNYIARWDGSAWQPMGTGMSGAVSALAVMPNGDMVAGGSFWSAGGTTAFNIARWNGSNWSALGSGCNGSVLALAVLGNGDLIAGGSFTQAGGGTLVNRVARWSGGSWQALGLGVDNSVRALAPMPNGDVVAGGAFTIAGGIPAGRLARWNGSAWQPLPGGGGMSLAAEVRALTSLPNGDLIVGGDRFTVPWPFGGTVTDNLVRLRGTTWESLWLGTDVFLSTPDVVYATAMKANGDIVVGGYFHLVADQISANFARLAVTCPATVSSYGVGCTGSGGANVLTAVTLPWLGSTFRARATGMPAAGFAVTVYGFAPLAVPIVTLLPQGGPGCQLLVTPDILGVLVPTAGALDTAVSLAASPSLIGQTFRHQVAAFATGGAGQVIAITSTNGLIAVVGSL